MRKIITAGIPDHEFVRGDVPMTKEEVRILSISKLRLEKGDRILDIGAGTGSISIEIARLLPESPVFAVEHNAKAIELIHENIVKFNISNVKVIEGKAPEALSRVQKVNKIFIGGSEGKLKEILEWITANTQSGTRVVLNAVTLNTLISARTLLPDAHFGNIEIIQVSINRIEKLGNSEMFRPQSPVFIISTTRI